MINLCILLKQRTAFPGASGTLHFLFCCPKCCLCLCFKGTHSNRYGTQMIGLDDQYLPPGSGDREASSQTHGHLQGVDSRAMSVAPLGRRNGRQAADTDHQQPPLKQIISVSIYYRKHRMNIGASLMSLFSSLGVLTLFEWVSVRCCLSRIHSPYFFSSQCLHFTLKMPWVPSYGQQVLPCSHRGPGPKSVPAVSSISPAVPAGAHEKFNQWELVQRNYGKGECLFPRERPGVWSLHMWPCTGSVCGGGGVTRESTQHGGTQTQEVGESRPRCGGVESHRGMRG